jgi:hypothetical protein
LLPWLSRLSVRGGPADRFRHRRSFRYQRISPLHRKFRPPLPPSSPPVSKALPQLSWGLSPLTWGAAYAPFKPSDSEQRSHGSSYRGCWHELSPCFLRGSVKPLAGPSSPPTGVYNPKAFILHAASLGQACAHCRRSSTAASRRSLASVSVPVARVVLSHPLGICPLVGRYPANQVIPREPLPRRNSFPAEGMRPWQIAGNYPPVRAARPVPGVGYPRLTAPFATSPAEGYPPAGFVRLACLIHAANVRSEPGSNPSKVVSLQRPAPREECRPSGN